MKNQSIKLTILLIAGLYVHSLVSAASLKVIVEGIEHHEGMLNIVLFDSEDKWLNEGIRVYDKSVDNSDICWAIQGIEPGEYAVSATHDVDENGELNKGAFGKPVEPYGFSNDARGMFGPAKWKDAKFHVKAGENEIRFRIK